MKIVILAILISLSFGSMVNYATYEGNILPHIYLVNLNTGDNLEVTVNWDTGDDYDIYLYGYNVANFITNDTSGTIALVESPATSGP